MMELLENPLIQLFLIVAAGMGLSWLSEREEQRRVAAGLPYRPLKDRVLEGMGFMNKPGRVVRLGPEDVKAVPSAPIIIEASDEIWVQAAKELELPIEKVLLLKEKVLNTKVQPATRPKRKDA